MGNVYHWSIFINISVSCSGQCMNTWNTMHFPCFSWKCLIANYLHVPQETIKLYCIGLLCNITDICQIWLCSMFCMSMHYTDNLTSKRIIEVNSNFAKALPTTITSKFHIFLPSTILPKYKRTLKMNHAHSLKMYSFKHWQKLFARLHNIALVAINFSLIKKPSAENHKSQSLGNKTMHQMIRTCCLYYTECTWFELY